MENIPLEIPASLYGVPEGFAFLQRFYGGINPQRGRLFWPGDIVCYPADGVSCSDISWQEPFEGIAPPDEAKMTIVRGTETIAIFVIVPRDEGVISMIDTHTTKPGESSRLIQICLTAETKADANAYLSALRSRLLGAGAREMTEPATD